jgi:hypothetical protein
LELLLEQRLMDLTLSKKKKLQQQKRKEKSKNEQLKSTK